MKIFDNTLATLERALDVRGQRHTMLAGNLANADTAQFSPMDIDFEAAMADAQSTPTAQSAEKLSGAPGIDGNTVDVDKTMAALAENGMQYGAAARAASKKLAILRYVAGDGAG